MLGRRLRAGKEGGTENEIDRWHLPTQWDITEQPAGEKHSKSGGWVIQNQT